VVAEDSYTVLTQEFMREVQAANAGRQISILLIGSVARSTQTSQSDLDLLVIGEQLPVIQRRPNRIHVQAVTTQQFGEKLRAGDDFAAWCVRYGVPLVISNDWLGIVGSSDANTWPDWRKKVPHAARRLTLAATLLDTGDVAAAAEEMLYAVSHAARATLLKNGAFPLSRPEIIGQLREAGKDPLAELLQELSYEEPTVALLRRALMYIKRLLVHIDRPAYEAFISTRRQHLISKNGRDLEANNAQRPARRRRLPGRSITPGKRKLSKPS
jgi:hypothetical protein